MKKIIYFITIIAVVAFSVSGCVSTIASVGEVVGKTYLHSKAEEAKARRQAKYIAEEIERTEKNGLEDFKISREIIEQHAFGENIVFVHEATDKKDKHGHIFIVYNKEEKKIRGWLFCSDEKDTYSKFQKMNLLEKKIFLLENFRQYANVDLGPVYPQIGTTYEQAVTAIGVPDDRIPLYYEEGIVVSEMLIYYETPKKFLAVDIARGKVARTQELEIKEGQGLKDALASAGITPAAGYDVKR